MRIIQLCSKLTLNLQMLLLIPGKILIPVRRSPGLTGNIVFTVHDRVVSW